jgi:hypothetical protein
MAGNAWEWASRDEGLPVLLGGGVDAPASELGRSGLRIPEAGAQPRLAGVRCIYDP